MSSEDYGAGSVSESTQALGSAPAPAPKPKASLRRRWSSAPVWGRLAQEAALPIRVPRWYLALRVLTKSMIYGLVVAWLAFIPVHGVGLVVLWLTLGVMWAVILAAAVVDILHRRRTSQSRMARLSDFCMLVAPVPIAVDLPALCIVLLVVGYVLQLRRISGGQVFMFALLGSIGAIILGTIALVGAESTHPSSSLAQPSTAVGFTMATLFRLTSVKLGSPVTEEGRLIVTVLQVVSAVFLGALYGGLLTMAVRDSTATRASGASAKASATDARLAYIIKQQKEILRRLDEMSPHAATSPVTAGDEKPMAGAEEAGADEA